MTVVAHTDGRTAESAIPQPWLESLLYYASRSPPGAIVEIGVYKGGSALLLSTLGREMFLYDTFEGIPFKGDDDGNEVGKFADTSYEAVKLLLPNATVVKGLFPDSIVSMPPVAFVHADADQYESTKSIIEVMPKRMVRGGMILFDDFGVPDCEGCTRAVMESELRILQIGESGKALVII